MDALRGLASKIDNKIQQVARDQAARVVADEYGGPSGTPDQRRDAATRRMVR